ncbi:putative mediator of RNA polymerase II transcription subunit 17 [Portunus trituberculatus]|uniref:putative mediator of RNA polymerase II transcription subunit 17 n=1 Tax=Portunus trituberculatus TaxID=210409 RepID=UPI001E1D020F|nr:putative mediator of RNA polymerase II transcription subunit 17 [Portunus trituberculatus]XP_045124446.1 putative mediator of RNA polymerase II transcription subunit 17 [Portunus trituberculatus]
MAKFLPVIGEAYTVIESGILIGSAGVAKLFGDDKAASELADSAGRSWKEYSETNGLAAPINVMIRDRMGDCERAHEIANSYLNAASSCVDGIPVVGHAKGIVHYAMGDKEKGHKSMEASTRNVAVLGAGIATGGLGAGLALGATAGIGAGVAYDATATIVDGAVNGKDSKLHGTIALARPDEMTPNEFVGGIIGIAGDGLTGAGGAQMGRNIRTRINGQRNLQNAYKNSQRLKRTGTDYRTATQVTMEAAEASKKAQGALNKQMNYATCEAVDSATGQKGVGHSGRYNSQFRAENFESLSYESRNAARNAHNYGEPSHLQNRYEHVRQVHPTRSQAACAEHPAFDNLAQRNPNYNPENVNTATVFKNKNNFNTAQRCENCRAYGSGMGKVVTDCIPDRTPVPLKGYVRDGFVMQAAGAATVGYAMNNDEDDETDSD